jgi:hypothetical protein
MWASVADVTSISLTGMSRLRTGLREASEFVRRNVALQIGLVEDLPGLSHTSSGSWLFRNTGAPRLTIANRGYGYRSPNDGQASIIAHSGLHAYFRDVRSGLSMGSVQSAKAGVA